MNALTPTFEEGDKAIWTIHPRGIEKRKECVIVEVVPSGNLPDKQYTEIHRKDTVLTPRAEESYVVREEGVKGGKAFHWAKNVDLAPFYIDGKEPKNPFNISVVRKHVEMENLDGDGDGKAPRGTDFEDFLIKAAKKVSEVFGQAISEVISKDFTAAVAEVWRREISITPVPSKPSKGTGALIEENEVLRNEMESLMQRIQDLDRAQAELLARNGDLTTALADKAARMDALENEINKTRSVSDPVLLKQIDAAQNINGQLRRELDSAIVDFRAKSRDYETLKHEVTAQKDSLLADVENLTAKLHKAEKALEVQVEESMRLTGELDRLEVPATSEQVQKLTQELEEAKGRADYYQKEALEKAKVKKPRKDSEFEPKELIRFVISSIYSDSQGAEYTAKDAQVEAMLDRWQSK